MNDASSGQSVPVFVVSLARAADRRAAISGHLQRLDVKFELVDAVDGKTLSPDDLARWVHPDCKIHPGAIGCYLSHISVYERIVRDEIPVALILEDDARVSPRVKGLLDQPFESLDFDYCFLDSDGHNDRGTVYYDTNSFIRLCDGIKAFELSAGPHTTHAYLITRRGAAKRLEAAFPIQRSIDLYDHLPQRFVFRAVVSPKLAWVSAQSLVSFTSAKATSSESLRFAFLRRFPLFYTLRNVLRSIYKRGESRPVAVANTGESDRRRRWRPLPFSRDVLLRD
jgi:GR25 family glycosyltransferase involved in LPS biosynthesis